MTSRFFPFALASALALAIALLPSASRAAELALDGHATQGGILFGRTAPGSAVELDGKSVTLAQDGRFVLGFGRDAKPESLLLLRHADGSREERRLAIAQRTYQTQSIAGLPLAFVTPPPEALARMKVEQLQINAARATLIREPLFASGFIWPVTGPISGVYGSQRILNGQPRAPHMGVDIAAPAGTPVRAPADGVVTLAAADFYLTGGTLILDHGLGLSSVFLHLSKLEVHVGEHVHQGDEVARVGATGRATGAHLHWGMNWQDARLDPALLVPPMPQAPPLSQAGAKAAPAGSGD
jgi:murein DD-endopeptidase MepM/ murein hydrolase activator NlpD